MRGITVVLALAILVMYAEGISIKWTGYQGNGMWNTATNWYPDQVPGPEDDVTIDSGIVTCNVPSGVNSLVMGTSFNAPANLTISSSFFVGGSNGLYVEENGNLFVAGVADLSGVVNVDGALYFQNGVLSGQITVSKKGIADLTGPGEKYFSGCNFVCQGPLSLNGLVIANESSVITISASTTISGATQFQESDTTSNLYDLSAANVAFSGPGEFQVQAPTNFGDLTITNGNLSLYSTINFEKSLHIPKNVYVNAISTTSIVNMSNGVTGGGILSAAGYTISLGGLNMTGYFNAVAGNVTFDSSDSVVGVFTFAGAEVHVTSKITVNQLNLLNGFATGSSHIKAQNAYIKCAGFILDTNLFLLGNAVVSGKSLIQFNSAASLWSAQVNTLHIPAGAGLTLTGNPGAATFTNDGTVAVAGTFSTQNIGVAGSGAFNVTSSLRIGSVSFSQDSINLSGSGSFRGSSSTLSINTITGSPNVKGTLGSYSFKCPAECDSVKTSSVPAATFAFVVSSSSRQH